MGTQASGVARLEGAQPSQVPCLLPRVSRCSLSPTTFLLTGQLAAMMVSCAASLSVDVVNKKQF